MSHIARQVRCFWLTSKKYPRLWRDMEAYVPPDPGDVLPELVEVAEVKSLAAAMAKMD
jgi:hypothetical protein